MMRLFLCRDGQIVEGPIPADQVYRMSLRSEVDPLALVRPEGEEGWQSFRDFFLTRPDAFSAEVHNVQREMGANVKMMAFVVWGAIVAIILFAIAGVIYLLTP